ncbi:phosphoserine phosphatase [Achromatium sp. WMS3]|nr:phosphoserine phosphatase [Achromatium sp. WMS3]
MALALFDLDNTLIAGDSDYLWGKFLVDLGVVDSENYERKNKQFYQEYNEGRLNIQAFLNFTLKPLTQYSLDQLVTWRTQFVEKHIEPIILPAGEKLIARHRAQGDKLLIITATNAFVTEPIAARLGVELLAAAPEQKDGRYTGRMAEVPCFREGKVIRLRAWLQANNISMDASTFYSDSCNDLPLLQLVTHPVAVDPDPILHQYADAHNWPIISLR